jgi:uncharacterized repeat protein (TIGR04138 family)
LDGDRDDEIREIVRRDGRYVAEAYTFLLEALDFTIRRRDAGRKHVSGPELLAGFRDLAVETFGFLARTVLAEWGVRSTDDVGEIVFGLIGQDLLQKTAEDRREDFRAVYDFAEAFDEGFTRSLEGVAI